VKSRRSKLLVLVLMQDKKLPSSVLLSKITSTLDALGSFSTYSDEPTSSILCAFDRQCEGKFFTNKMHQMTQHDLAVAFHFLVREHENTRQKLLEWKKQPLSTPLIDDYLYTLDLATPHQVRPFVTEIARLRQGVCRLAIKKRKLCHLDGVVTSFMDAFCSEKWSFDALCNELDLHEFCKSIDLYNKCFQHACNARGLVTSFKRLVLVIQGQIETSESLGPSGFVIESSQVALKKYLWARKFVINELVVKQEIWGGFLNKNHQQHVAKRIMEDWIPVLAEFMSSVLCAMVIDYATDNFLFLQCRIPPALLKRENQLIEPLWVSLLQHQVPNCNFWK
jgi:hypothetical protein